MRLESLTLRGFMTAFAGKQVAIDFAGLPDGLIALVGGNGEGKTTFLEGSPASVFRQMMSRDGDLKTYAMDRDSFLESGWSGGLTTRVSVDGIKGGSSAVLARDGQPLNDGKVSTFDAAVAGIFPPLHVFKASAFAAQNKTGSFVKASKKERRDIFASFLGLDRLVAMSDTAKLAAAEVEKVRIRIRADVDTLTRETAVEILDGLRRQIAALDVAGTQAEARKQHATDAMTAAEQRLALLADATVAHAAAAQQVAHQADVLASRQRDLDQHVADDLVATLAEGTEFAALTDRHAADQRHWRDRQAAALLAESRELTALDAARDAKLADLDKKLTGNAQIQAQGDDIRAAVAAVTELTPTVDRLRARRGELLEQQQAISTQQAENELVIAGFTRPQADLDRATADAGLLEHVPCGGRDAYAGCQLLVNAKAAEGRIADLEAQLTGLVAANETRTALLEQGRDVARVAVRAKTDLAELEKHLQAAQAAAQYAEALAASDARIEELTTQRVTVGVDAAHLRAQALTRFEVAADQRRTEQIAIDRDLADVQQALTVRIDARLATATAKRDALTAAVTEATQRHTAALEALHALVDRHQVAATLQADLAQLRADRDAAVTAIATATSDAAAVAQRLEDLLSKAARLIVLQGRLTRIETELLEWQLLQQALGRDGLPDLEIDQAGPAISAIANEILADCFESRFSIELVTQVAKADGKEMKAEFTVLVTDNQGGDTRDVSDLSGGEEVIIAEALMNAIAIFVNERSTTPMRTCFRDETTGALSKENTQRYVQMLRKVQAIGGFRQIVFISHDPDAYALADAQLLVAGGTVTPLLPPYQTAA